MKKLITILMCLQMIIAPVAYSQATSGSSGDQFRENPQAKKQGGSIMNQILGISQAAVGTTAIGMCRMGLMLPSIMIYMAGSLAYIASEVLGGKAKGDALKKKADDIKMVEEKMKKGGGGGDVQKEALVQALKDEEDNLAFVKKRKMWLTAIAAIYAAAAAAAIIENVRLVTTLAAPGGQALAAALPPPFMAGICSPAGALGSVVVVKGVAAAYAILIGMTQESSIGKYGSMLAALLAVVTPLSATIAMALNTPMGRAAIFAAHGVVVWTIKGELTAKEQAFTENIKKLKAAIANFEKDAEPTNGILADTSTTSGSTDGSNSDGTSTSGSSNGTTSGSSSGAGSKSGTSSTPSGLSSNVNSLASGSGNENRLCWGKTTDGMEYSATACGNPTTVVPAKFDASLNVPTLSTAATLANDMAQGFAEGNTAKAEVAAASLASMAGNINQVRDNLMKQMNDKLKAEGKEAIDLDAEANKQLASMNGAMNTALGTENSGLAGLGSNSSNSTMLAPDDKTKTDAEKSAIGSASSDKVIAAPATGSAIHSAPSDSALGITEGISSPKDSSNADASAQASLSKSLNDYEMNESDISEADGVSLFQQVSNRYLRSYPKILQRKQVEPVPAPNPNSPPN